MTDIPSFSIGLIFLLILAGWIVSEVISRNEKDIKNQYAKQLDKLNNEKSELQKSLAKENVRYTRVKEECEYLSEFVDNIPTLKVNHGNLSKELSCVSENIQALRLKLNNRDYASNPCAESILNILCEYFPTEVDNEAKRSVKLTENFSRIKGMMDS